MCWLTHSDDQTQLCIHLWLQGGWKWSGVMGTVTVILTMVCTHTENNQISSPAINFPQGILLFFCITCTEVLLLATGLNWSLYWLCLSRGGDLPSPGTRRQFERERRSADRFPLRCFGRIRLWFRRWRLTFPPHVQSVSEPENTG